MRSRHWARSADAPRRAGVTHSESEHHAHVVLAEAPRARPASLASVAVFPVRPLRLGAWSGAGRRPGGAPRVALRAGPGDVAVFTCTAAGHVPAPPQRWLAASRTRRSRPVREGDARRVLRPAGSSRKDRPVVFMFSGPVLAVRGHGSGVYEAEPLFREDLDLGAERSPPSLGLDLRTGAL